MAFPAIACCRSHCSYADTVHGEPRQGGDIPTALGVGIPPPGHFVADFELGHLYTPGGTGFEYPSVSDNQA